MRDARRLLAASFVVTVSAGCDARPSAPATTPTVNLPAAAAPGDTATATASATTTATPSPGAPSTAATASATAPAMATATAPAATGTQEALGFAPPGGRLTPNGDGTCLWIAENRCPPPTNGRIIHCNPPPPRRVKCPPDAGL